MSFFYPNGIGGSAPGPTLDICKPLQVSGNVWYVSSLTGVDAASPAGQNREKPIATLSQAYTNALAGDIIVFLAGHNETLAANFTIAKQLTLIGEGQANGKPSVSFRSSGAAATLLTLNAVDCQLLGLYFPPPTISNSSVRLRLLQSGAVLDGCYFESNGFDVNTTLSVEASNARIDNCTFISTATSRALLPSRAIATPGTALALSPFYMNGTTISGGTYGFANDALDFTGDTVTKIRVLNLSLLLGADANFVSGALYSYVSVPVSTGGSRVLI